MEWSELQKDIFRDFKSGPGHSIVQARAGTGKTTTILEGVSHIPRGAKILLTAFGTKIVKELERRNRSPAQVRTLHSLGLALIRKDERFQGVDVDNKKAKARQIAKDVALEQGLPTSRDCIARLAKLTSLAKNTLAETDLDLLYIAKHYDIEDKDFPAEMLVPAAKEMLIRMLNEIRLVDFDDMLWFPYKYNLTYASFDHVIIDEVQDLNKVQYWLTSNSVREDGRIIGVGDDKQALYAWRGAEQDLMRSMTSQLRANVWPLSITYRCPTSVVDIVRPIVPDFTAAPGAPPGTVLHIPRSSLEDRVRPGDFILSRVNAPLMHICLSLLKQGIPATVAGRDIGRSLCDLAEKSRETTISGLLIWLDSYFELERERLLDEDAEDRLERLRDKIEALKAVCLGQTSVAAVTAKIEAMFTDDEDDMNRVVCSTVHKAKGLERDNVFVLMETMRPGKNQAERNIYYVALTRTKNNLYLVKAD